MGCWISVKEPCGKCFGCYGLDPASISTKFKLWNSTVIVSDCIFEVDY